MTPRIATDQAPWFGSDASSALASFWKPCESSIDAGLSAVHAYVLEQDGDALWLPAAGEAASARARLLQMLHLGIEGDWSHLSQSLLTNATSWSRDGVSLAIWHAAMRIMQSHVSRALVAHYANVPEQLEACLDVLHRIVEWATNLVTHSYVDARERLVKEERLSAERASLHFSRLSESGILGVLVCDLSGNAKEANDGFLAMVGYTRDDLVAGRMKWTEMTPPEWKHLDDDAVTQLQERGYTRTWEKEYIRKDGSRVPILVGVAMHGDSDCVAYVLDISERKRLEEMRRESAELEAQNSRIREASRLKSEFLANMSHELRTPLNSIIGFADLLYDGEVGLDSEQYRDFVGDILKSGRHLLQLINDVLDLAKVESGTMDFRPERVALPTLVDEVCSMLRTVANAKQIRLEAFVDSSLDYVTIDPARLKQVLYNYASNALKFSAPQDSVRIRAVPETASTFRVEVIDTGVGIAPADLGRLFVEFQQLDAGTAKKHAGTGLGLALTKRIVEAQQGHVGVTSTLGGGSTFFAVLPCQAVVSSDPEHAWLAAQRQRRAVSVLVVDDDVRDRALIARTLDRAGYGVETAANGEDAIAFCRARAFDAVTLDLILPDLSGLQVLRAMRAEGRNKDTPVLIVSVVAEKGVVGGFPVHDYLQKPLQEGDLVTSLERAGIHPSTSGTILVVDDDPSAIKLMDVMLRRHGYNVMCSNDGERALSTAARHRPRAVILDLLMPGVDGFEFLARFRNIRENLEVPVIVWTTKDLTAQDRRTLDLLTQGVFSKDQGSHLLVDELRCLLNAKLRTSAPDAQVQEHEHGGE